MLDPTGDLPCIVPSSSHIQMPCMQASEQAEIAACDRGGSEEDFVGPQEIFGLAEDLPTNSHDGRIEYQWPLGSVLHMIS